MTAKNEYTDLPVTATRDEAAGVYTFTVALDGADFTVATHKIGDVDERVGLAREQAQAASQATTDAGASAPGQPA